MSTRHFARIGAVVLVSLALTMTVLALRDDPAPRPSMGLPSAAVRDQALHAALQRCAALGNVATGDADCRQAWDEKRRRFLGLPAGRGTAATAASSGPEAE